MSELNKDTWREDHLAFKHEGKEKEYQEWCLLCKNKVEGEKAEPVEDLGVNLGDNVSQEDKFGG